MPVEEGVVKFNLYVNVSCANGGGQVECDVITDQDGPVDFAIVGETNNFGENAIGSQYSHTFTNVPDGTYTVSARSTYNNGSAEKPGIKVECGLTQVPTCDLEISSIDTTPSQTNTATGTATINTQHSNLVSFRVDDDPWGTSNYFHALKPGVHMAYVRYINNNSCQDSMEFIIPAPNVLGCTNEEADNYNRDATEDDGTCVFTPRVYATGGILPNPVFVPISFPTTVAGVNKTNHYVRLNLYKVGETAPFASLRQTLRDGKARVDIATYLRNKMQNDLQDSPLMIFGNPNHSMGYYVGVVEHYGGQAQSEQLRMQPLRFAVNAALPDYPGNIMPYVVEPGAAPLKDFMYTITDPVLIEGYNQSAHIFIRPDAPQPLYFQRRYLDAYRQDVEIRSTLIPAFYYGTRVDFNLYDRAISCAEYVVLTLETEQNLLTGLCPDTEPDPDGQIFDYTFPPVFE